MNKIGKIIHKEKNNETDLVINNIDKICSSIREIILKLYNKAQSDNLDTDTIAFLMYMAERLENNCIDLKDVNIEIIRNSLMERCDRSKLLIDIMQEKEALMKEQQQMQLETARYFEHMEYEETNDKTSLLVKH